MTTDDGPKRSSDDAELFAVALLKARLVAGSATAAARPCSELLDRFEERVGERGLRLLTTHLVELAAGLAGGRLAALERLEQMELDALHRQQQPGPDPGP
ncbi:hypothetical protein [Kitasatospora sp. NPDC057015]|uniref:hypothetical protein n=1 Tax=Kitasatospora sp. NPDC057015 TaxID=3346001 RepID=UPI003628F89A